MAWDFDNGPAIHSSTGGTGRRSADPRERVIRSAAYAPVAFGRRACESLAVQNMRYRDAAPRPARGDSA